jgi:hypothetical protein
MISVTPVSDGMILKKGVKTSPLGGNYLSQQTRMMFAQQQPYVPLVPHFMIKSKSPVDAGQPSLATYRKFEVPPTDSFRAFQEERVLHEFKESVVELWPGPGKLSAGNGQGQTNEDVAARNSPGKTFEMPDGWNQVFGVERFKVGEALYDEKAAYTDADHPAPTKDQTIPELIAASLSAVDQDVRPHLLNNILIVGAGSFQKGLVRRFDMEIKQMFPSPNVRLSAPSNYYDRSYASWIGGSILASLGSFHQVCGSLAKRCIETDLYSFGFRAKSTRRMDPASLRSAASDSASPCLIMIKSLLALWVWLIQSWLDWAATRADGCISHLAQSLRPLRLFDEANIHNHRRMFRSGTTMNHGGNCCISVDGRDECLPRPQGASYVE